MDTAMHFQEQDQQDDDNSSSSGMSIVEEAVPAHHSSDADEDEDDDEPDEKPTYPSVALSEQIKHKCYPNGCSLHIIPLALCILSVACTFAGSWDCNYFEGASISFTGSDYGLWTLKDTYGKCQLWDVLFFSYDLGVPLRAARVFSMAAMMLGLALVVTHAQALQCHAVSWAIPIALVVLVIVSMTSTKIFNMWIFYWLFTYIIYVVIVRALFLHPVQRRISKRGSKIIASLHVVCATSCLLTLVVLRSDYCTCENLTIDSLEGRDPGDPCDNVCELRWAGIMMIISCFLWTTTAVATLKIGVQPELLHSKGTEHLFGFYRRTSIATRILDIRLNTSRTRNETEDCSSGNGAEAVDGEGAECVLRNAESGSTDQYDDDDEEKDESENEGDKRELDESEEDMVDPRGRCQKLCCDFRVVPRTRNEKVAFWTVRVLLGALFAVYVFIVVFFIGSRAESTRAAKAPDTTRFFVLEEVCAFNPLDPSSPFETFASKQQASDAGYAVAHCGACGSCSNPTDIETYVKTRKTVAKKSKDCGVQAVFGSYDKLINCLEDKIGFSRDCTFCWAQNMKNTVKFCIFTCTTTMIRGFMQSNNVAGVGDEAWLNSCLFCDERRSGPTFVTCSGVARRRMGIESEIERRPDELCTKTDVDWLNVDWPELFPGQ